MLLELLDAAGLVRSRFAGVAGLVERVLAGETGCCLAEVGDRHLAAQEALVGRAGADGRDAELAAGDERRAVGEELTAAGVVAPFAGRCGDEDGADGVAVRRGTGVVGLQFGQRARGVEPAVPQEHVAVGRRRLDRTEHDAQVQDQEVAAARHGALVGREPAAFAVREVRERGGGDELGGREGEAAFARRAEAGQCLQGQVGDDCGDHAGVGEPALREGLVLRFVAHDGVELCLAAGDDDAAVRVDEQEAVGLVPTERVNRDAVADGGAAAGACDDGALLLDPATRVGRTRGDEATNGGGDAELVEQFEHVGGHNWLPLTGVRLELR